MTRRARGWRAAAAGAAALLVFVCPVVGARGQTARGPGAAAERAWALESGGVVYRLAVARDGRFVLTYFGPAGGAAWDTATATRSDELADFADRVPGAASDTGPAFRLVADTASAGPGGRELRFTFRHRRLPIDVEARYAAWGETGVFTRQLTVRNRGAGPLPLESASPVLAWTLPRGRYTQRVLHGGWGREREVRVEPVAVGARRFEQASGRSTHGYVPWLSLRDEGRGVEYLADLAWSGNWWMQVERPPVGGWGAPPDQPLGVRLGLRHDFGGALAVAPGEALALPAVAFTAARGDLDDAANRMHRYQRAHVVPRSAANTPPLVHFNSWYALGDSVKEVPLLRSVDLAAEAGAEAYILDSGWYNEQDWSAELGDYRVSRRKFPRGLEAVADHVRARGMTFGLWVEIENVGRGSRVLREHPDWCLSDGGRPLVRGGRCQLDFAKPEVRRWATATVERLVRDYGLGWIKIDYNVDIGDRFDPAPGGHAGGRLRDHLAAYYAWLDELRAAHPRLVVENCSSGALRFDLGIMAHAHTAWVSDVVSPEASPALRYGCTLQFAAALCNHWMVGENDRGEVKPGGAPGWWDYMFRVAMNGQFGLSGRLAEWEPALRARAAENVALYKRVRATVADGDVYHLTPPPRPVRPAGWMALQYAAPAGDRSVVMAYRLDGPAAADTAFRLRGLRPDAEYDVARDGRPVARLRGAALAAGGLPVALAEPWRAAVYELSAR